MPADYGGRTPLQTAWLALAAALVVAMLGGGGWLGWRGVTSSAGGTSPGSSAAALAAESGAVAFGAPEIVEGVPWGYPLTAEGAAAAAMTVVAVTGQPDAIFDQQRFEQVAEVVFISEEAAAQSAEVEAARAQLELSSWSEQPPSRRIFHFAPLAVRLVAHDATGHTARAEVWAMTLMGVGDAGGAAFTTSTVDLEATPDGGTWQVTALDSVQGPTPMVPGTASAPGHTRRLLRESVATLPLPVGEWP